MLLFWAGLPFKGLAMNTGTEVAMSVSTPAR